MIVRKRFDILLNVVSGDNRAGVSRVRTVDFVLANEADIGGAASELRYAILVVSLEEVSSIASLARIDLLQLLLSIFTEQHVVHLLEDFF